MFLERADVEIFKVLHLNTDVGQAIIEKLRQSFQKIYAIYYIAESQLDHIFRSEEKLLISDRSELDLIPSPS